MNDDFIVVNKFTGNYFFEPTADKAIELAHKIANGFSHANIGVYKKVIAFTGTEVKDGKESD